MEITWDIEPDKLLDRTIAQYIARIRKGLLAIAKRRATEIAADMKENRPWTDRTHDAKNTLDATAEEVEQGLIELLLQHGVTYGWFLEGYDVRSGVMAEMMRGSKFAILAPSVDKWGPVIMQDIRQLVGG